MLNLHALTGLLRDPELRQKLSQVTSAKIKADIKSLQANAELSRRLIEATTRRGNRADPAQPERMLKAVVNEHLDYFGTLTELSAAFSDRLLAMLTAMGNGTNGGVASGSGGGSGGHQVAVAGSSMVAELCLSQHADYVEYRAQVMAEFSSFPCMADADCLAFFDQSACDPSCVRLATAARRGVVDRLNNFETSGCAQECSPQPWLACPRATPSRCVSGRCQ